MTETLRPSTPFAASVDRIEQLEDWGPLGEATAEAMATSGLTLWNGDDVDEVGVWECTPGPSRWLLETNELVFVVKGRMTVTADGESPFEMGAGDTAVFPKGWSGTWDIHETLRKVYAIF
jgi:uncharacterized protein